MLVSQLTSQMHCTTRSLLNVLRFAFLNSSSSGGTTLFSPLTNPAHNNFVQGVTRAVEEGLKGLLATGDEDEGPKALLTGESFEPFTISMLAPAPSPSPERSSRSGGTRAPLPHNRASTTSTSAADDEADEEASPIVATSSASSAYRDNITPARPTPTQNRYPSNANGNNTSSSEANLLLSASSVVPPVPLAAFVAHAPSSMGPPQFTPLRHNRRSGAHHQPHHPQQQQPQYPETARTPSRPPAIAVASSSSCSASASDADIVMMTSSAAGSQTPLASHPQRMSTTPILRNKPLLLRPETTSAAAPAQQQQQPQQQAQTPTRRPLPHNYAAPASSPRAASASSASSAVAALPVSFSAAISALQSSPSMPVSPVNKKQRTTPQSSPSRPVQTAPQPQLGGGRVVNPMQVSQWESEMASLQSLQREVAEGAHHKLSAAAGGGRGHKRRSGGQEKHSAATQQAASLSASMPALPRALLMMPPAAAAATAAAAAAAASSASSMAMVSLAPAVSSSSNLKSLQAKAKLLGGGGNLQSHPRQASGMLPPMMGSMLPPPSPASSSLMQQHTPSHTRSASALGTITLSSHSQSNSAAGAAGGASGLLKGRPPLPKLAASASANTHKLLKPQAHALSDEPNENVAPPETPSTARNRPGTVPLSARSDSPQQTPRLGQAKPKLLGALPPQHSESTHSLIPKPSPSLKKTTSALQLGTAGNRPLSAQAHSPMRRA